MPGSIPLENTRVIRQLPSLSSMMLFTDLLHLFRPVGVDPVIGVDYQLTIQEISDFIRTGLAPLDSPIFINTPTAPTQPSNDDTTKLATTEFVHNLVDNLDGALSLTSFIFRWEPFVFYQNARVVGSNTAPPDFVVHDGDIYQVVVDHTSPSEFNEYIPDGFGGHITVLQRITQDHDLEYSELAFNAVGPFAGTPELCAYMAVRQGRVRLDYLIPNPRQDFNRAIYLAVCNPEITADVVIEVRRAGYLQPTAETTIATITFGPSGNTQGRRGLLEINDPLSPSGEETTGFEIIRGMMYRFVLVSYPAELSWLRVNLLAELRSFVDPDTREYGV